MKDQLTCLLEAQRQHYDAHFSHVEHQVVLDHPPAATIRLHYVRADASGEPRFQQLAQQLAQLLAKYITFYCFTAARRKDLTEFERNEMYIRARDLFRHAANSGQVGELLVYFLLETVLNAPQALKKMPMTTNPNEERKGSDGVHLLWDTNDQVLELVFAESKIWSSFSRGLTDAFKSMDSFHESRTKGFEINVITSNFSNLDPILQEQVKSYLEGENVSKCRLAQACLIGFDWGEYACLSDGRRAAFLAEFDARYKAWVVGVKDSLSEKLKAFKHKHLRFEFFLLPFRDVEAFRSWFEEALTGKK